MAGEGRKPKGRSRYSNLFHVQQPIAFNEDEMNKIIILILASMIGGCAIGQKVDYTNGSIKFDEFEFNAEQGCVINVVDQRPYIISRDKKSNFVGIVRGSLGNPWNLTTKSGEPLADDLEALIEKSYVDIFGANCDDSDTARKVITYVLNEWKTDTYIFGKLVFDIDTVIEINGDQVSIENTSGHISMDTKFHLSDAVIFVFNEINSNKATNFYLSN